MTPRDHNAATAASAPATPAVKPPSQIQLDWQGEHRFDYGRPGKPTARADASGATGPGPLNTLLGALAACASVDVIDILEKRRTPAKRLSVIATGDRAQSTPAKFVRVLLEYTIEGDSIDRAHAERAVDLSLSKYCSVRATLDPALPVSFSVKLNGETGPVRVAGVVASP